MRDIRKYDFVDALRGWAFFFVLLLHVSQKIPRLSYQLAWGQHGVQLFFVLSAFTLFHSFSARNASGSETTTSYLIRRLFRIAPLFWLAIIFYTLFRDSVILWLLPREADISSVFLTALFAHGWHPYSINAVVPGGWTIAVEMNFYLMLPVFFKYVSSLKRAVLLGILLLLFRLAANYLYTRFFSSGTDLDARFVYFWLPNQLPVFSLGFILYFLVRGHLEGPADSSGEMKPRPFLAEALMIIFLTVFLFGIMGKTFFATHIYFGIAFFILAWSLALKPYSFFVNRLTCFAGKLSYSAYLWHFFCVSTMMQAGVHLGMKYNLPYLPERYYFIILTASFITTLALSSVTYYAVEQPFQRLVKKLLSAQPAA